MNTDILRGKWNQVKGEVKSQWGKLTDDDLDRVEKLMSDRQIRRVVVVDGAGDCVGIIAQADLARASKRSQEPTPKEMVDVLEKISKP